MNPSLSRGPLLPARMRPPAILWIAAAIFVLFLLLVPRFGTAGNIENVLRIAAILGIVSCGQAIVIILGGIEFSFGASAALASVLIVMVPPEAGVPAAFAAGALGVVAIGMANGLAVARFGIPPVIVTLGMLMMASGIAAWLAGGMPIDAPMSDLFAWPSRGRVAGVPVPILAAILAFAVLHVLLAHSRLGRLWYLVGANPVAARLAGLAVTRIVFAGYAVAGLFCAVGAVILTSRVGSGQPSLAPNLAFETIAACAIGGLPLTGGRGRVSQVVCGVLLVAMLDNAVVLLNLPAADQLIVMGLLVVGAVALQRDWKRLACLLPNRRRP
ncbi:ABC transporter permease [Labrys monachus]|uniref:Ribose/xylose/arabinose/galactoside ABC-type transport system permease subunit n=1 Tax=Labrys monachus TaxID=217067 RepID=A0ABU0F9X7_9HYPH|nr:ABC transporter permease [Labrys monachus]MDQ0391414.1 ribose/xylose/arabinose/galactoside ABC-type transport system permease subunit [Labrys monachus]